MGHEGDYTKADILDLSQKRQDFELHSSTWLRSTLDSQNVKPENHKKDCHYVQNNCNILGVPISAEELKIRSEIGMEIERDLEEEIKEGIYHLALRLHRIHQQRKERSAKETFELDNNGARAVSEVNISIRMEGVTKVEIKEVNKEAAEKGLLPSRNSASQNVKEVKKVDWVKTLRAGSSPVCANRSCVNSKQKDKKLSTNANAFSNLKIHGGRGKNAGSSGLVKLNASVDKKILQLGWKI
ncbi:hypothetical protein VNO78_08928 [Psophocarpus tetragonolobus]|uniref:Uncharacterized protein n=1 Tax=Psophocarpus tetragonolobus TaxID=3891 RepID=A0AAN9SYR4_PSOTE